MIAWTLLAALATAQTPADPWETATTEHFRVHYPVSAEEWGKEAAGQLEAIRERVNAEVGWVPPRTIDVVIVDPYGQANGSAWPFTRNPRMLLWATPPAADSVIGHYRTWGELLLTHEYAHLVHLLRESRNPLERMLEVAPGLAPITRKAPRWCIEGYATVVEARLSGFGRPNADFRAQLLRMLAQGGKLPTYGELNAFDRFYGGSFAYLVGSAYLEWLEARAGQGSLRDLWARMTAKEIRSFEEAFSGVFGDSPEVLYARFSAEITAEAMAIEAARPMDEGTLWNDLGWYTGGPAVSPDGTKLAAVVSTRNKPSVLKVWSTAEPDEEALEERQEKLDELIEEDPEDVLPVEPKHPPRKELHSRRRITRNATEPHWMPDGEQILFTSWQPAGPGRVAPDLFLWNPETGDERRLTRRQNLRSADPFPDGERALAVRQDWGRTHLVIVDLQTGDWEALSEPTLDVIYDSPRVSPVRDRVAWMEHRGGGWSIVVHDADARTKTTIAGRPGGAIPTHIAWSPDGASLYASMGSNGFIELHEVWGTNGAKGQLTRSRGGALAPAAAADALYYLSMDPAGFEIHRLELDAVEAGKAVAAMAPVVRPVWTEGPAEPEVVEVEAGPYKGRTEWRPLIGGSWSRSQAAIEGGIRLGDIVGRRDVLLVGSYGRNSGVTGGRLALAWRRLPVDLGVQGFAAWEPPEFLRRAGGLAEMKKQYQWSGANLAWSMAGSYDQPLSADGEEQDGQVTVVVPGARAVGYGYLGLAWVEPATAALRVAGRVRGQLGSTDGAGWSRAELKGSVGLGRLQWARGSYTLGLSDAQTNLDRYRLGGVLTSALPDAWQWTRIASPVFDLGSGRGANRDAVEVALGQPGTLALVGERHRMSDALDRLGAQGSSAVSLAGGIESDALPFQRLPAFRAETGLGCRVEDPVDGWAAKPCQTVDDYAFWFRVGWDL